tara:strand:- start:7090 stop:8169 length:1080 start_codon:yes stop_codon:yes gene_type:complete
MLETLEKFLPQQIQPYLFKEFLGNTVEIYVAAFIVFIASLVVFKIFQLIVISRLKKLALKTKTDIDDTLITIVNSLRPPFYSFLAFYVAAQFLTLSFLIDKVLSVILIFWVVYQIIHAVQILIDYLVRKKMGEENERATRSATALISLIAKIVLWSMGLLFILSNIGVNVTSLIAGLGVGGIAIAFALQSVLSDLFSSFSIYFDKPFVPGDFIVVGDKAGTVEKIGIKTTRIRALQGEELVFSNADLTSSIVQNFKKLEERRVVFTIGVTYDTTSEKLQTALSIIRKAIEDTSGTRFDRTNFHKFNDSSLDIETVYYAQTSDYTEYVNAHEAILFAIKEEFEKEKIEFAYPSQTIYLEK